MIVLVTTFPYGQLVMVGAQEEMVSSLVVVIVKTVELPERAVLAVLPS